MVEGVTDGFERQPRDPGRRLPRPPSGRNLELCVGYSHTVTVEAPDGIEFEVPQPTQVIVRGIDKQLVGEIAARIRRVRPPEPYKGKGIRYRGRAGRAARSASGHSHDRHHEAPARLRRRRRVRAKIRGNAERPRLSVFRSNRGISAQLIDDDRGATVAAVAWTEPELRKLDSAGRRRSRRASCSRRGPRTRASRPASSTVAATATTAACARSPKPLARAA